MTNKDNSSIYLTPHSLKHHLLIATPSIDDDLFTQSIIYICEHNDDGAMGLMINKPITDLTMGEVLGQIKVAHTPEKQSYEVLKGGPVKRERGFVLHDGSTHWESNLQINTQINLTTSKDILIDIGQDAGPDNYLFALGFCGWSANQLEEEIVDNRWLIMEADQDILFHTDTGAMREKISAALNIDLNLMSHNHGRA